MDSPTFQSDSQAIEHYRTLARNLQYDLDDTKSALDEFHISSKELEAELEKELQSTERQLKELRGKEESLVHEIDQWKLKYHACLKDHTKTMTHMQGELDTLRKSNEEYRTRLRDMELDNDELEGKERMVTSSLQDVENKYGKAIERITLLEDELIEKSRLEEECQRLRDELRDMSEEIVILRDQQANIIEPRDLTLLPSSSHQAMTPVSMLDETCSELSTQDLPSTADPGMEVLKDPKDMASPLRVIGRTKPTLVSTNSQASPRRRLVSMTVNSSPGQSSPISRKSSPTLISKKPGSLRIKSPLGADRPALTEILPTGSRLPPPGHLSAGTRLSFKKEPNQPSDANNTPSRNRITNPGRSHLQSLRAETQRMQGMTKKLVSSRTLRQVSAIPVPKPTGVPSMMKAGNALNRSVNTKSPAKKTTGIPTSSRIPSTQTSRSQEREGESPPSRRPSRLSQAGIPRPKARPSSRLSMGTEQPNLMRGLPVRRSATPSQSNLMRKPSIDGREMYARPKSVQANYRPISGHVRRQSQGIPNQSIVLGRSAGPIRSKTGLS